MGDLLYLYTQRVNLGTIRTDENALWCLGPHDISMALHLFNEFPESVQATGQSFLMPGRPDVVFVHMVFPSGRIAQLQVSWLDPNKIRRLTVVGNQKMAVFDDQHPSEKLRIYDKGVEPSGDALDGTVPVLRFGEISSPPIAPIEPLKIECQHFLEAVLSRRQPLTQGRHGLEVVQILDAAQRSMDLGGVPVKLKVLNHVP